MGSYLNSAYQLLNHKTVLFCSKKQTTAKKPPHTWEGQASAKVIANCKLTLYYFFFLNPSTGSQSECNLT